jgi:hypothetical protein
MATSSELVERALRVIAPDPTPEQAVRLRSALMVRLASALESLAIKVAGSRDKNVRNLLRKDFTATLASGTADLSTLLTGTQPVLLDAMRFADIRHADSTLKVQMLADRGSLAQEKPAAFLFGAVEGSTLYIPDADDGSLSITANYVERSVANLKLQLEPMLIDELVGDLIPAKERAA